MSAEAVLSLIPLAERQYARLILVVGPTGAGKTAVLREVAQSLSCTVVNTGRDVAERLLGVRPRFRSLEVARALDDTLPVDGPALLDNTEILFDPSLDLDPLHLLRGLARNQVVIATWNGTIMHGQLTYGPVHHPAARRYAAADLLAVPLHPTSP